MSKRSHSPTLVQDDTELSRQAAERATPSQDSLTMMLIATLALTAMGSIMTPAADPPQCLTEIQKLFKSDSYAAAAREADTCWGRTGDRNALYMGIQLRRRLGHCAHVLVLTQRLLRLPGLPPDDRDALELIEEQCREQSVELHVRFAPSMTGPEGLLRAAPLGAEDDELLIVLALNSGEPGDRRVYLDPGEWLLRLERDDDVQTLTIDVTVMTEVTFPNPPPPPEEIVQEPPRPPSGVDEQTWRKSAMKTETTLGYGTLAPALPLSISGAALVGVGTRKYRGGLRDLTRDPREGGETALEGVKSTSEGMALLGASLGAGVVALTDFAGGDQRALIAETAMGGALAVGGLAWTLVAIQSYARVQVAPKPEELEEHLKNHYPQDLAAHGMLGLGAGLATSAAISLLVTTLRQRKGRVHARHVARRRRSMASPLRYRNNTR